ncbi:IS607 family transposase, partial [Hydrogenibacillus schlegelii]|uniref:IS607 family transposase n=1 Tax=Hydrogenibacillus schlegelii TaxID=1484 RepID=UPI0034A052D6
MRLPSGHRRYPTEEIDRILKAGGMNETEPDAVALYARVSTKKRGRRGKPRSAAGKASGLRREKRYRVVAEYTDVASGLNQKRRGLDRMLKADEHGEFKRLLIESQDRLALFGFDYLERHLKFCGEEIEVISQKEPEEAHAELVQDLLAIITSFSARIYGARGGRKIRRGFQELM